MGWSLPAAAREWAACGADHKRRVSRLEEHVEVWRMLWRGEPITHQGEDFELTLLDPRVTQYRLLPADQPPSVLEDEMLARWSDEDILARTLAAREGRENFVFFEGPPTANGKPGIHHVFSRTIKD